MRVIKPGNDNTHHVLGEIIKNLQYKIFKKKEKSTVRNNRLGISLKKEIKRLILFPFS